VTSPLTWRFGLRPQREFVVDDERVVHPIRLGSIRTRIDGNQIGTDPHHGDSVVSTLITHDPRLDVIAIFVRQRDRLKRHHGPTKEVTADAGR